MEATRMKILHLINYAGSGGTEKYWQDSAGAVVSM